MSQDYARALAKITVAQIAEATGFQAVQQSAGDALAELLLQYVSEIGSATHAYAELAGRTDCNVNDVLLAFQDMGISVEELMDYADSLEDIPFAYAIPRFPVSKRPPSVQSFIEKGEDPPAHIPAFLPAFPDKHTYVDTPTFVGHTKDPREQKLAQEQARKEAEKAVVKLAERAKSKQKSAAKVAPEASQPATAGNPFLAVPDTEAGAPPQEPAGTEASNGPSTMDIDGQAPITATPKGAWEEAGQAAASQAQPQMLAVPLKLDWTTPSPLLARTGLSDLGFEDAFANATSEATGAGGRRRRASMKAKAGGDPASLRAEQLLAAGADAMALEEAAGEKAGR